MRITNPSRWKRPKLWLAAYGVALALIAFWPTQVDEGARPLLDAITRAVPLLTYPVIEFSANIALFVPLGALLQLTLRRPARAVVVAMLLSAAIEATQALALGGRTGSVLDIVANTAGAAVGAAIVGALNARGGKE